MPTHDFSTRYKRYSKFNLSNVNIGGIGDSMYNGGKSGVDDMLGFDIHSEVGVMKVNQNLTSDAGGTITEPVIMVQSSDSNTYFFGTTTGKIWARDYIGTYTLVATNAQGATYGAAEYKGYIYYFSTVYVGRWQIGHAWSTRVDNWGSGGAGVDRPTCILNDVLYYGNGTYVGQVDTGVNTYNALTMPNNFTVTALGQMGTDLLVGTQTSVSPFQAQIFRWNTWSVSFTSSDPLPETRVWAFLPMNNFILVAAGNLGKIYIYNGATVDVYKQVRLDPEAIGTQAAVVFPYAVLNFNGKAMFGMSVVYSLARFNRNYAYVLNKEVGISTGNYNHTTDYITSMVQVGGVNAPNYFLVAWVSPINGTWGVDRYDYTKKYSQAYIQSRVIAIDRFDLVTYGDFEVAWRTKPANCGFVFSTKLNTGAMTAVAGGDVIPDTQRNIDKTKIDIGEATSIQVRIDVGVYQNTAPEIEQIEVGLSTID